MCGMIESEGRYIQHIIYLFLIEERYHTMEIRHLRYFVAVAEQRNFRRAAEHLLMAQPPLSQQIQDLEKELDVQLFDRTHRQIALTVAGQVFLEDATRILAQSTGKVGNGSAPCAPCRDERERG